MQRLTFVLSLFADIFIQFSEGTVVLNLTVFYQWMDERTRLVFNTALKPAYEDTLIRYHIHVTLIPFGMCKFSTLDENRGRIRCPGGFEQYLGNALQSCYFDLHPDNEEQVEFALCMQGGEDDEPVAVGRQCSKEVRISGEDDFPLVTACSIGERGDLLQRDAGYRTTVHRPVISTVPVFVFNNDPILTRKYQRRTCCDLREMILAYMDDFCTDIYGVLMNIERARPSQDIHREMCSRVKFIMFPRKFGIALSEIQLAAAEREC